MTQPVHDSPEGASGFVSVVKVRDLPPGQGGTFCINGRLVAVFNVDGQYRAIDDLCPHMGASLGAGWVEGDTVTCPWHAWRFSLCDGRWKDSPQSGVRVQCYEVRVVGDDVQVRVPAE